MIWAYNGLDCLGRGEQSVRAHVIALPRARNPFLGGLSARVAVCSEVIRLIGWYRWTVHEDAGRIPLCEVCRAIARGDASPVPHAIAEAHTRTPGSGPLYRMPSLIADGEDRHALARSIPKSLRRRASPRRSSP